MVKPIGVVSAVAIVAVALAIAVVAWRVRGRDPERRGRNLFATHCASCHLLGELGDPKKATAAKLDGWGTAQWIAAMIHDPDAPEFFGRGPFKGKMRSVDIRPPDTPPEVWSPVIKDDAEKHAVSLFVASQGDEPADPPRVLDEATRAAGEEIVTARCEECHLYKGEGDAEMYSGFAPELSHYGSLSWTRSVIANPATAETYRDLALDAQLENHMPRFDGKLSAADIDLLARWTREHARALPPKWP
jgi:mono/diheme cytochrome c family protein